MGRNPESRPVMVDLCCGLGGASAPMRARGWRVESVDIRSDVGADVVTDLKDYSWHGGPVDLLWASPPCDEFTKLRLKQWHPRQGFPLRTLTLIGEIARLYAEIRPRWLVLENVAGAIPYLGTPARRVGPFCLWGVFPFFLASPDTPKLWPKHGKGARVFRKLARARIPYQLGDNLAQSVEFYRRCELEPDRTVGPDLLLAQDCSRGDR